MVLIINVSLRNNIFTFCLFKTAFHFSTLLFLMASHFQFLVFLRNLICWKVIYPQHLCTVLETFCLCYSDACAGGRTATLTRMFHHLMCKFLLCSVEHFPDIHLGRFLNILAKLSEKNLVELCLELCTSLEGNWYSLRTPQNSLAASLSCCHLLPLRCFPAWPLVESRDLSFTVVAGGLSGPCREVISVCDFLAELHFWILSWV